MTHLWEMSTSWFPKPNNEHIQSTFTYKSWNDFREYKPYKLWKPYILSSWSWKKMKKEAFEFQPAPKRTDTEKHAMNCAHILRKNPSQYDKERIQLPPNTDEVDMLQIVFLSPDRFQGMHRVEILVQESDEKVVKEWLQGHMPSFWKLV